jgi:CelD/BcsL family acetyltransferase involved in cellulose biosynthesis
VSGYFSSISLDELTAISPGEMLLYLVAEQCATEGMAYIDLGAGDERYKRSWCDMRIGMFDVIMPTSLAGVPFAAASRLANTGKRIIRESPQLWSAVGAARQVRSLVYRSFGKS